MITVRLTTRPAIVERVKEKIGEKNWNFKQFKWINVANFQLFVIWEGGGGYFDEPRLER